MKHIIVIIVSIFICVTAIAQTDNSKRKPIQTSSPTAVEHKKTSVASGQNGNSSYSEVKNSKIIKKNKKPVVREKHLTAVKLQNSIVEDFNNIITCRRDSIRVIIQYVDSIYDSINTKLIELCKQVSSDEQKYVINGVLASIEHEDRKETVEKTVEKTRLWYQPVGVARMFAKKCRDKIKELKIE